MKNGRTLNELAAELTRQMESKKDFLATTDALTFSAAENALTLGDSGSFKITPHTHRQISSYTEIPAKYYDRMGAEAPDLLDRNVQYWFDANPTPRLVRTLDGKARAFLSNSYQCIDNYEIAETVLPVLQEMDLNVISCEVTERRMYLKAVTPKVRGELKVGDEVQAGIVISNSEIGQGAVQVEPLVFRLVCLNGMVTSKGMRRNHVGRRNMLGDDNIQELLQDDTRRADDKVLLMKIRDVTRAALDEVQFRKEVDRFRESMGEKIVGNPVKVIEELSNRYQMIEAEKTSVLTHLIQGGELSQFGLINAVTRASQDLDNYDRATEFEQLGGRILSLPKTEWRSLAEAA